MQIKLNKPIGVILFLISYMAYYITVKVFDADVSIQNEDSVFFLSWLGIVIFAVTILLWHKREKTFFTLFNVFLIFLLMFNFGHCILWAFGIHFNDEIGNGLLYKQFTISSYDIIKAQLLFCSSFIFINCGALFCDKRGNGLSQEIGVFFDKNIEKYEMLYKASKVLAVVAIPSTFYIKINNLFVSFKYGRKILVSAAYDYPTFLKILSSLFFICLFGLLIGSNYDKKVRKNVYIIFALYAAIDALSGERSEWIIGLIIILWMDYYLYKKWKMKKFIVWFVLAVIGLNIVRGIVAFRNGGISVENVSKFINSDENPLASQIGEFGQSMGVNIVVLKEDIKYPYGVSYVTSLISAPTTSIMKIFIPNYQQLGSWFSNDVLVNIGYSADFTVFAEAVINFGIYLAPLVFFMIGFLIKKIMSNIPYGFYFDKPLLSCLLLSMIPPMIKLGRSTSWAFFGACFWPIVIMSSIYYFFSTVKQRKRIIVK